MIDKGSAGKGDYTTVIGNDCTFKGELTFDKGVRVDGRIEGQVTTKGRLAVSQGGKVHAEVRAGSIVVEGEVVGNLTAMDRIELRQTARLKGDLRCAKLLVAEGATVIGQCHVGPEAAKGGSAASNRLTEKEALPRK